MRVRHADLRYLVGKKQTGGHTLWYWQPDRKLLEAGGGEFRTRSLGRDFPTAIRQAAAFNAELDAWRRGGTRVAAAMPDTLPWLIGLYRKSSSFNRLAKSTAYNREGHCRKIEVWSAHNGHPKIGTIESLACGSFSYPDKRTIWSGRSHQLH